MVKKICVTRTAMQATLNNELFKPRISRMDTNSESLRPRCRLAECYRPDGAYKQRAYASVLSVGDIKTLCGTRGLLCTLNYLGSHRLNRLDRLRTRYASALIAEYFWHTKYTKITKYGESLRPRCHPGYIHSAFSRPRESSDACICVNL